MQQWGHLHLDTMQSKGSYSTNISDLETTVLGSQDSRRLFWGLYEVFRGKWQCSTKFRICIFLFLFCANICSIWDSRIPGDFSGAVTSGRDVAPDLGSAISAPSFSPPKTFFRCSCICFICFICAIDLFNPDIPHWGIADGALMH